ncbi:MAG: ElyC/SanA/YdcF family protein [Leptospirales bacterium]
MLKRFFLSIPSFGIGLALSLTLWNVNQADKVKKNIFYNVGNAPSTEMAIVLGASVKANGEPSPMLAERLEAAVKLYHQKNVSKILISGDSTDDYYDEIKIMKKQLLAKGIPAENLIEDGLGVRTLDSLYRARNVHNIQEAIIVSQFYHLPRAIYLADHFGIKAVGFSASAPGIQPSFRHIFREFLARYLAFFDVQLFHTKPDITAQP